MTQFLYKFACFDCNVAFKRQATLDSSTGSAHQAEPELTHTCPNCGRKMAFLGRNFSAPAKSDKPGWHAAMRLWEAGFRFVGSGYHNDPPLPRNKADVEEFIKTNRNHSQKVCGEQSWNNYA